MGTKDLNRQSAYWCMKSMRCVDLGLSFPFVAPRIPQNSSSVLASRLVLCVLSAVEYLFSGTGLSVCVCVCVCVYVRK
jgi:hypothetical protein